MKQSWLNVNPYKIVDEVRGREEVFHYPFLCAALLTQMAQVNQERHVSAHGHHGQA